MNYAISLYDRDGFYGVVLGTTAAEARQLASKRGARAIGLVAMTIPYPIGYAVSGQPDVSLPDDFRDAISALENVMRRIV